MSLFRENNARLHFIDKEGRSALHFAASKDHHRIVKFIVEHSEMDVLNMMDHNGDTALHFAVMNNALKCLSILIEAGADSSILNHDMNAPVHMAVILNRTSILKEMVQHKDKVNVMIRGKHGRVSLLIGVLECSVLSLHISFNRLHCTLQQSMITMSVPEYC